MSGAKKGVAVKLLVGKFENSVSPELPTHGSGIILGGAEIGTLVAPGLGTAVGGFFGCVVPRFPIEFGGGGAGGSW